MIMGDLLRNEYAADKIVPTLNMADKQRSEGKPKKRKNKADKTNCSKKLKQDEGKEKQTFLSAFGFECSVRQEKGEPQPGPDEETQTDEKAFQEKWLYPLKT